MFLRYISLYFLFVIVVCAACNKSTSFGSDLLGDQTLETIFTDTLAIQMRMLPEDSVLTSDPNSIAPYLLCGRLNDPVLGESEAIVYSGIQFSAVGLNFKNVKLDSVVLYLGIDPAGTYGDTNAVHEFEVKLLEKHPSRADRFYSDASIPVQTGSSALLGSGSWLPTPNQGRPIIDSASTVRDSSYGAWFSMRLSDDFGKALLALDSATVDNDTLFWAKYPGVQIRSKTAGAVLGLNLNDRGFSRITLYYRKDTANAPQRVANLQFIGENKFSQFIKTPSSFFSDRPGVVVDDVLALQGMRGQKIEVDIPYLKDPKKANWSINTADLLLYVASVQNDNLSKYTPAKQLSATVSVGDTTYALLADLVYSTNVTGNPYLLFGGNPVQVTIGGTPYRQYKLSLPAHLQDILLKRQPKTKFFINLAQQARSAERLIVHSPSLNPVSPTRARLNLRYTIVE